ncbi:thioredoxin reductase, partial [Reticulomyxa filosa]
VAVVGGGDTAMEEAIFLTKFAKKVYVIHRRNELKASKIMQDRAMKNPKIEFVWDTVITDVLRNDQKMVSLDSLFKMSTRKKFYFTHPRKRKMITPFNFLKFNNRYWLFLAIGHKPNTETFKGQLDLDSHGYIVVEKGGVRTSVPGVFACGDVQDSRYRQAITAAGTGCMAAMDAAKYLEDFFTQHT